METCRLKNIAILILLLLNAVLLLLLGHQHLQARHSAREADGQLRALYAAGQLALDDSVDLGQQPLTPLALVRREETEQAIAACLLGGSAVSASQGGGIYSYAGDCGTIQFRAGGSFDGSRLTLAVDDITEFARQFCRQFGYENAVLQIKERSGTVTAVQQVQGVPVAGCGVTLRFDRGVLTAVSGAHVSLEDASPEAGGRMSCITALVRFLDHRAAAGIVCSEVTGVSCVYELQGGGALRLLPKWQVETDTYTYFVDCATGEVSRH